MWGSSDPNWNFSPVPRKNTAAFSQPGQGIGDEHYQGDPGFRRTEESHLGAKPNQFVQEQEATPSIKEAARSLEERS